MVSTELLTDLYIRVTEGQADYTIPVGESIFSIAIFGDAEEGYTVFTHERVIGERTIWEKTYNRLGRSEKRKPAIAASVQTTVAPVILEQIDTIDKQRAQEIINTSKAA